MNMIQELISWLEATDEFEQADWDKLPDIGLYMDQVQSYIDRQISLYGKADSEKLLTPAMINNYIKDDLIPRAESKKYSPVHVALLIMIASLKQVLSMQNLKQLLADCRETGLVRDLYEHYQMKRQQDLIAISEDVLAFLNAPGPGDQDEIEFLRLLALDLSIEARNRTLLSEKILEKLARLRELKEADAEENEVRHKAEARQKQDSKQKSDLKQKPAPN